MLFMGKSTISTHFQQLQYVNVYQRVKHPGKNHTIFEETLQIICTYEGFHKLEYPKWFVMENPIQMGDVQGYPHFRKPPYTCNIPHAWSCSTPTLGWVNAVTAMQSHRWFHHPASYWGTPIFRAGNLRAHDSEGYPYFRKSLYNQILGLDFHDIGCNQPEMILLDILQLGNLQRMFFQLGTVDSSIL